MAKNKSVKEELYESLEKDKTVILGLDAKIPYFVNSGHYGLNRVLSGRWLGGWSAGTVGEMFGDPSCLVAGTRVVLADGSIVSIDSLGNKHLQHIDVLMQKGNGDNAVAKVFHKYEKQNVTEIILSDGSRVTGTHNHPLLTTAGWMTIDELQLGDTLMTTSFIPCHITDYIKTGFVVEQSHLGPRYNGKMPQVVDEELASVMGYVLGDGWVRKKGVGFLVNPDEIDILGKLLVYMDNLFGVAAHTQVRVGKDHYYEGKLFKSKKALTSVEYSRNAVTKALGFLSEKRIPDLIMRSGNSIMSSFLRWLFEAAGCCFSKGRGSRAVALKTAYLDLALDVQLALRRFGIRARIIKWTNSAGRISYNIRIGSRDNILLFDKYIGFVSNKKIIKLQQLVSDVNKMRKPRDSKPETVVAINRLSKQQDVFDIEIPEGHQFVANGIISHNTGKSLLTSRAMVSLQRKEIYINEGCEKEVDLTDTFIILDDTEKAYQEKFCKMQGMDINDLIKLHKTLTVETHFTQMEDKVNKIRALTKQAPLGVFCDSISQLSTDNEMEKGMETTDMGNKAKKVHQAMRLYSDYIYSNMVMYLANSHVTDSPNPYGPKRVIKGGKGMAFQSTVRLDLRYLSKFIRNMMDTSEVGERGETYGVKILAETVKNRVAPPFMFTIIDVYFDRGIDPYSGLFDHFTRTGQIMLKPADKKKKEKEKEKEPEEKGKKKKKKKIDPDSIYLFDGKHEFKHAELPQLIIAQDLLGVKAAGFEYMTPIDAGELVEEDLEEDDKDFPTAAPPPLPPVPRREPMGE